MSEFHTMTTKSGRTFTPLSDYDVLNEIYEDMGQDVHDYVANRILDINVEQNIAQQKFESDYTAMECEVENWHTFVDDLSEDIDQLRTKIETTGITKAKISVELWNIFEKMRKAL